jgi:CDP-diacylglycerol--glycerol-3-phosphate 3-phosphatidyltransferase
MSIYAVKPAFQGMLRPGVGRLAAWGVTANAVTLAAAALSLAEGAAIAATGGARWSLLALPAVLLLRMGLNAADGMLAREHGQSSRLGACLNEVCDVVSDAALYLPLALVFAPGWPVVLAVAAGLIAEVAGLSAALAGGRRRYDGPVGKPDRALAFGAAAIAAAFVPLPPALVIAASTAIAAGGLLAAVRRIREDSHA